MQLEVVNIWKKEQYYQEVIDFWNDLGALPKEADPEKRAQQLVMMSKKDGKVIGVTTAVPVSLPHLNDNVFFNFRILIHPKHRFPGHSVKLTVETRNFLEQLFLNNQTKCIGIVAILENSNYVKRRNEAVLKDSLLIYLGKLEDGRQIRVYYFKGAKI